MYPPASRQPMSVAKDILYEVVCVVYILASHRQAFGIKYVKIEREKGGELDRLHIYFSQLEGIYIYMCCVEVATFSLYVLLTLSYT